MDDSDGTIKVRSKNKATYLKHRDCFPELKQRKKRGKCLGPLEDAEDCRCTTPTAYNVISSDIWFHIADHIRPEDVQTFALICRETASLVETRKFWRNLYKRYCLEANPMLWMFQLPAHLQINVGYYSDMQTLRGHVISALFYCHTPLLGRKYPLDTLIGRTYIASWHQQCQCVWIMCYKFWNQLATSENASSKATPSPASAASELVNDWESLAISGSDGSSDETADQITSRKFTNPHEGVSILVICCKRFIPFPTHLIYGRQGCSSTTLVRLLAARQMLTQDLRGSNLELDFVDAISKAVTTVKYPNILKFKIIPWWHPDFRKFVK